MKKNPKVKSGTTTTGLRRDKLAEFKTADEAVAWAKERQHVYNAFGSDKAIKTAWSEAQPAVASPQKK